MKIINYVGIAALALVAGCASPYKSNKASLETISQNAKQRYVDACAKRSPVDLSEGDKVSGLFYETLENQLVGVFEREPPISRLELDDLGDGIVRASYDSVNNRRIHCVFSYQACSSQHKHMSAKQAVYLCFDKNSDGGVVVKSVAVPLSRPEKQVCVDWSDAGVEKQMKLELDKLERSIDAEMNRSLFTDAEMNRSLFTFPEKRPEAKPSVPDPVIPSKESDNALLEKLLPKYVGDAY